MSESITTRLARIGFTGAVRRDASGAPRISPEFVADQGRRVRILDVRDEADLMGPRGYVPAVTHVPMAQLGEVPTILDPDTLVVLVSNYSDRAAVAARYLEALGMRFVAAMDGGMHGWKKLGFTTGRAPGGWRTELVALAPGIGRDGKPLERGEGTVTAAQVLAHVGDAGAVRWVKLGSFVLYGRRSCVDGRDDHGVIGTPGGDMGELLLALSAAEELRDTALDDAAVDALLLAYVDTFGRFYMHSDVHAANHMIVEGYRKDERIVPYIGKTFEPAEWRAWNAKPPMEARAAVLEQMVDPAHVGCGHLRLAMTDPEYGVRPGLPAQLMRAFHRLRWAGAPELELAILGGDHHEGAVLVITIDDELHATTPIPLVSPQVDGSQAFISHPQVIGWMRSELVAFLVRQGVVPAEQAPTLLARIQALGDVQTGRTLGRLAKGLPVFKVRFGDNGATVEAAGVIP